MSLTSPERGYLLERIDYDSGAIEGVAAALATLVDHAADACVVLDSIHHGLEGRGRAIDTATDAAGRLSQRVQPTAATIGRIVDVLRGYVDAVTSHARTANDLIDEIEAAHAALQVAEEAASDARAQQDALSADASWAAVTDAASAVDDADGDLDARRGALGELWSRWESAYRCWDDAYGTALAALVAATGAADDAGIRLVISSLAHADTPAEVAAIWASLSAQEQQALFERHPGFIGNLEGVPYPVRFDANRAVYDRTVRAMPYGDPLDGQLRQLGEELGPEFAGELLMFHPFEQPQATAAVMYGTAVARDDSGRIVGDPFTGTTNVSTLVGGMFSSLDDLAAWGESARNLNRFADAYGGPGTRSVTIAWYGYDSPNLLTEHTMGSATEGAARLTSTLRGVEQELGSGVTSSVIGHSYGSTTAFLAVGGADGQTGVDRLIAVGSAGVPDGYHAAWTGDDPMDYSGVEVYASRAPWDFVARYGEVSSFGHGTDPADIPGATQFESDGGTAPTLSGGSETVLGTPGHAAHDGGNSVWGWWESDNGYLSRDSESFRNIASIVAKGEVLQ
ncbi:alpha/beta hydrolase [Microbacterium sp.]|uniref:alpha/beta hydrolase n=1 Tax=Microbacterium sp. TaxID=51671 RepID=UPI00289B3DFE|nr:alpha/beta hydrolase [Microbacterium sp.]